MKGRFESRWKLVFLARVVRHEHLLILFFTRGTCFTRGPRIALRIGHFGHDVTHVRHNIITVDGRTSIQVRIVLSTNFAIFVKALKVVNLCFNFMWHILVRAVIVVRLHDVVIADALRVILTGGTFAHRVRFEVIQRRRGRRASRRAVNRQSRNALALDVIIVVIVIVIVFRANTTTAKEGGGY